MGIFETLSIIDTLHKMSHSLTALYNYAECRVWFIAMLNVIILSVVAPLRPQKLWNLMKINVFNFFITITNKFTDYRSNLTSLFVNLSIFSNCEFYQNRKLQVIRTDDVAHKPASSGKWSVLTKLWFFLDCALIATHFWPKQKNNVSLYINLSSLDIHSQLKITASLLFPIMLWKIITIF